MKITIEYQLKNSDGIVTKEIDYRDYFEFDDEFDDEDVYIDTMPKYDHAYSYIDITPNIINFTKLKIISADNKDSLTITEKYWNNGENFCIERVNNIKNKFNNEIIIQSKIAVDPPTFEIIRLVKKDDIIQPVMHVISQEDTDDPEEWNMLQEV